MNALQESFQKKSLEELIKLLGKQEEMVSLLEELQVENEMLEKTGTELRNRINSLEQELLKAKTELLEKDEDLDELTQLSNSLNNENSKQNEQIQALIKQNSDLLRLTEKLKKQISELMSLKE